MYVRVHVEEMRKHLRRLRGAQLSVLMALALHVNAAGRCWPSLKRLAALTGYSKREVIRALHALAGEPGEKDGDRAEDKPPSLITIHRERDERGVPKTNVYTIDDALITCGRLRRKGG